MYANDGMHVCVRTEYELIPATVKTLHLRNFALEFSRLLGRVVHQNR